MKSQHSAKKSRSKRLRHRFERVNNLRLFDDSLQHIHFELGRKRPNYFRVAKEGELALHRAMIEALRGSANFAILGRRAKDRKMQFERQGQWRETQKGPPAQNCQKAWRFTNPVPCPPPVIQSAPKAAAASTTKPLPRPPDEYLLPFYDLLAMVQSEAFMGNTVMAKPVKIDDSQMRQLEWLHENVRNEFEHFVPKGYMIDTQSLVEACGLTLTISQWLLRKSGTVLLLPGCGGMLKRLDSALKKLRKV